MKRQKVRIDGKVIVTRAKTWFNHNGKRHKIADYPVDKDNKSGESPVNGVNITTKIASESGVTEEVKGKENAEKVKLPEATGDTRTQITYNERDGSFSIEKVDASDMPKEPEKPDVKTDVKAGSYTKAREVAEKPDVDAPENILDSVWKRSTLEVLVPVGLLLCGYAMKKEAEPGNAQFGENVRKHGFAGGWLKNGSNNDW